jgi:hypothetical protein
MIINSAASLPNLLDSSASTINLEVNLSSVEPISRLNDTGSTLHR